MVQKKFFNTQVLKNSWNFIKEQWSGLIKKDWLKIYCYSSAAFGGLILLIAAMVALNVAYFMYYAGMDLNFKEATSSLFAKFSDKPYMLVMSVIVSLLNLFLIIKIIKYAIGFMNVTMSNALDAMQGRPMRRFGHRDERLSFMFFPFVLLLFFLFALLVLLFFIISLGSLSAFTSSVFSLKGIVGPSLLTIPMFMLIARFYIVYPIMLEEKLSPIDALRKSWNMTKGNFWTLFILLIFVTAPSYILLLIQWMIPENNYINVFIGFIRSGISLFAPLIMSWLTVSLYVQLKKSK